MNSVILGSALAVSAIPTVLTLVLAPKDWYTAIVFTLVFALSAGYFVVNPPKEPVNRTEQFRAAGCVNTGYHGRYDSRLWTCPNGLIYRE